MVVRAARLSSLLSLVLLSLVLLACSQEGESAAPESSSPESSESRPVSPSQGASIEDVVLITVDTLRFDAVGFAAEQSWAPETPNLSALAAQGRVFHNAKAHNTVTLPSHANILTGQYPYQHGVRDNAGFRLPEDIPTLTTMLQAEGFATGAFVSAYPLDARFGLARGFDVYDDSVVQSHGERAFFVSERPGTETVARALEWWNSQAGTKRFLFLHVFDPHAPYEPPAPWDEVYEHPYQGEIATVDAFLGEVIESTPGALVVFTADHGEGLGDHGETSHGLFAYRSTLAVPLLLAGPNVEAGEDLRLARHIDILPTVLDGLGMPIPEGLPGSSLLQPAPKEVISYFEALTGVLERGWAPLRGVQRDQLKYIELPIPELYDLAADPGELNNLAKQRRSDLRDLRALLPEESNWPPQASAIGAEEAARLRSLGYLAESAARQESYGPEDDPKTLIALDQKIHQFSALYSQRRFAEAAQVASELVSARPSMGVGYSQWSQALLELGDRRQAIEVMNDARERGVASSVLLQQLGLTLAETGRADEAVDILQELHQESKDPAVASTLGLALTEAGRAEEAVTVLLDSLQQDSGNAKTYERLSVSALHLRRVAEAKLYAGRAVELDPGLPHAWNNLGVARFMSGDGAGALEAWRESLALDGDQFDTLYNLGVRAAELGRTDIARQALRDFINRAPQGRYGADLPKARQLLSQLGG